MYEYSTVRASTQDNMKINDNNLDIFKKKIRRSIEVDK